MTNVPLCRCGCGEEVAPGKTWRRGHCQRGKIVRSYTVDETTGCWNWDLGKTAAGYGRTRDGVKDVYAHRFYYEQHKGAIPEGLELDHLCRNRACCNPEHLEAVTHAENMRRGKIASKTHCDYGHELDGVNPSGWRYCLTCSRERALARYYRLKAEAVAA